MPQPINISASRAAALLGQSEYQTPVSVWLQIMEARDPGFCARRGYTLPVIEYTPAMRWGHAFESAVIELAERKAGIKIVLREYLFTKDFLTCHIDGAYDTPDSESVDVLHEGKTTSEFYYHTHFGDPGTDKVPPEYQIQCQHQMICTGAERVILSVLVFPRRVEEWEEMGWEVQNRGDKFWLFNPGKGGKYYEIPPIDWATPLAQMGFFHQYEINAHPELQSKMLTRYREFWEVNVLGAREPEPQSMDDIKCLCPSPVGTVVADEAIERMLYERESIKSEISATGALGKRVEQIKIAALDYMRNAGAVLDDESKDKWLLLSRDGRKLASYYRDKRGYYIFR
jgi:hypothetical protein